MRNCVSVPADIVPASTSREPIHSTATTEAEDRRMTKKVRKERAKTEARAAWKAVSTAAAKRPVT